MIGPIEFSGRKFGMLRASDVDRDGMALEAYEVIPGGTLRTVLEAFWRDSDNRLTFSAYEPDLPFELVEMFVAQVRPRLTPSRSVNEGDI
jgi:hypothetical protein